MENDEKKEAVDETVEESSNVPKSAEEPLEGKEENSSADAVDSPPSPKTEDLEYDSEPPKADDSDKADASDGENATELKATIKEQASQIKELNSVIKWLVDSELAKLSDEDKKLIEALGGKSPASQLSTLNALKDAGKVGAKVEPPKEKPPADRTRIASQDAGEEKPRSWADADRTFAKKVSRLKR